MTTCGRLPTYGTRVTTYNQSYQIQLKTSVLTLLRYIYLRALIYLLYLREYIPLTSHVPLTPYFILPALVTGIISSGQGKCSGNKTGHKNNMQQRKENNACYTFCSRASRVPRNSARCSTCERNIRIPVYVRIVRWSPVATIR